MFSKDFIPLSVSFLIWSSWVIPVRLLGENAFTMAFFTTLFAAFFWGIVFFIKQRSGKKVSINKIGGLFLLAIFFTFNMLTYLGALKYTDAAVAVLTHYTAPIFVAFLAPLFLREKVKKDTIFSLVIAFTGFFIIFFKRPPGNGTTVLGTVLGLLSGLFYAFIIITGKMLLQKVEKADLLFFQNLFSFVFLAALSKNVISICLLIPMLSYL